MQNYLPKGLEFNGDVLKDLKNIDKEIEKESKNPEKDKEKLLKLKMEKLYRGMELTAGLHGRSPRAMYPY